MNGAAGQLATTLQVAVPLRIGELQALSAGRRWMLANRWIAAAADVIVCQGGKLAVRTERGDPARVFEHLARSLAVSACTPGGTSFAGIHWCVQHRYGIPVAEVFDVFDLCGVRCDDDTVGWAQCRPVETVHADAAVL